MRASPPPAPLLLLILLVSSPATAEAAAAAAKDANTNAACPPDTATIVSDRSYVQVRRDPIGERPDGTAIPAEPAGPWDTLNVRVVTAGDLVDQGSVGMDDGGGGSLRGPAESWSNAEVQLHVVPVDPPPVGPIESSGGLDQADAEVVSKEEDEVWYEMSESYLMEIGQPIGIWESSASGPASTDNSSSSAAGGSIRFPANALFHCEEVTFEYTDDSTSGEEPIGAVILRDFILGISDSENSASTAFAYDGVPCEKIIYNPCDNHFGTDGSSDGEETVCQAVNGRVSCILPGASLDGMPSPLPGLTRRQYFDLYRCVDYGFSAMTEEQSPIITDETNTHDLLYWDGEHAFLQATNVTASLSDGTSYTFIDDNNRPQVINSGGEGEEISREDDWMEFGMERRLKFYFMPNSTIGSQGYPEFPWADRAKEDGWYLYEARMYGSDQDEGSNFNDDDNVHNTNSQEYYPSWITSRNGNGGASQIGVPPGYDLFYCDLVEYNFDAGWQNDNSGKFVARDMFIGAFLPSYPYKVCGMKVYNPCRDDNDDSNLSFCQAVDGKVTCIEKPAFSTALTEIAIEMQMRSSAASSEKLICVNPDDNDVPSAVHADVDKPAAPPTTLVWEGKLSFLFAKDATATYSDGTALSFDDQDGRQQCIRSGGWGEELQRNQYWYEGNIQRGLSFYFTGLPANGETTAQEGNGNNNSGNVEHEEEFEMEEEAEAEEEAHADHTSSVNAVAENDHDADVDDFTSPPFNAEGGWKLYRSHINENAYPYPDTLVWTTPKESTMIQVPSNKHLFHCEYVEFNYKKYDDYRAKDAAKFVGHDVVMGGYLQEGYDICELELYNPCHETGVSGGPFCRAVNGIVMCSEMDMPALVGRAGFESFDNYAACVQEAHGAIDAGNSEPGPTSIAAKLGVAACLPGVASSSLFLLWCMCTLSI